MNNKRGFIVSSSTLIALIVTGIFIASFQPLIMGKAKMNNEISGFMQTKVNSRNGLERLHALYGEDIANEDVNIVYEDLDLEYKVVEKSRDVSVIEIETTNNDTFFINNPTSLKIDIDFIDLSTWDEQAHYSFDITKDGVSILSEVLEDINTGLIINIDEQKIGKNYGNYEVHYSTTNSDIVVGVTYLEQTYRELEITENNKIKRAIIIENDVISKNVNQYMETR